MNQETREQIALARYKLISPVLAEPDRVQNEYFRGQADKEPLDAHAQGPPGARTGEGQGRGTPRRQVRPHQ